MSKNIKPVVHKRNVRRWMPQRTSHFVLLVLLIMGLLFLVFYFFLKNKAH